MNKLVLLLFLFFITYVFSPSRYPFPHKQNLRICNRKYEKIELNWISIPKIIIFGFGLVSLFWLILLHTCNQVKYIMFSTNLIPEEVKFYHSPFVAAFVNFAIIAALN